MTEKCLMSVHRLNKENIRINAILVFKISQGLMATILDNLFKNYGNIL